MATGNAVNVDVAEIEAAGQMSAVETNAVETELPKGPAHVLAEAAAAFGKAAHALATEMDEVVGIVLETEGRIAEVQRQQNAANDQLGAVQAKQQGEELMLVGREAQMGSFNARLAAIESRLNMEAPDTKKKRPSRSRTPTRSRAKGAAKR